MTRPDSRLVFFICMLGLLMLAWGCGQSDNITASVSLTNVWLTAERLPTPPPGMVYELWVAKGQVTDTAIPSSDLASLGRFSYVNNDSLVAYLETDGSLRADTNKFVLDGDMFDYGTLFLTVEQLNDPEPTRPGPIMLVQYISGETDTMRMIFPLCDGPEKLWEATVRYNMESVSDLNRYGLNGYGVWFSQYEYSRVNIPDTLTQGLQFAIVTVTADIDPETGETLNLDMLGKMYRDTTIEHLDTVGLTFGRDTLVLGVAGPVQHIFVELTDITSVRNAFPFRYKTQSPYAVVADSNFIDFDIFEQDGYGLPVYDDWGWKYRGWIVSDHINPAAVGEFTPPAWPIHTLNKEYVPGYGGGLLTTGTFSRIDQPDDGDPFTLKVVDHIEDDGMGHVDTVFEKPKVPGEDFLDGAALAAATNGVYSSPINLLPAPGGNNYGTVFITLEPANKPASLDSTNFPLIAFSWQFPPSWNYPSGAADTGVVHQVTMQNWSRHVPGDYYGFPQVTAKIKRQ